MNDHEYQINLTIYRLLKEYNPITLRSNNIFIDTKVYDIIRRWLKSKITVSNKELIEYKLQQEGFDNIVIPGHIGWAHKDSILYRINITNPKNLEWTNFISLINDETEESTIINLGESDRQTEDSLKEIIRRYEIHKKYIRKKYLSISSLNINRIKDNFQNFPLAKALVVISSPILF